MQSFMVHWVTLTSLRNAQLYVGKEHSLKKRLVPLWETRTSQFKVGYYLIRN